MLKAIYHSLHLSHLYPELYERQWIQSVRSIRRFNQSIPLFLVLYGTPRQPILDECRRHNVHLIHGNRQTMFEGVSSEVVYAIRRYPVIHKFAALNLLPITERVLYIDCDTFFFRDPEILFEKYASADWYAREEPGTFRSNGNDGLDRYMAELATQHERRIIPPYNMGVCLFNHGSALRLGRLTPKFFTNVYRFMLDINRRDPNEGVAKNARASGLTAHRNQTTALSYPPFYLIHPWIVEQVALWFTWGELPNFSHDVLLREDVNQSEPEYDPARTPVLCHYYHLSEYDFFAKAARLEE